MTNSCPFNIGDRVICNPSETRPQYHGTIWTVERIDRVNVVVRPVDGGRGLRIHPSALLPAPTGTNGTTTTSTAVTVPYLPPLAIGAAVTVASPRWRGTDLLYVVLGEGSNDTLRLALLGGDHNQVWRGIPRGWVAEVDRAALLTAVAGLRRPA